MAKLECTGRGTLSELIRVIPAELLNGSVGANQLCSLSKSQHPAEKLIADLNLGCYAEMVLVHCCILDDAFIIAKTVNNGIQKGIDKTDGYALLLAAEHGEDALGVGFQVDCSKGFCAISRLACKAYIFHAVYAVGPYILLVIIKRQQIIISTY